MLTRRAVLGHALALPAITALARPALAAEPEIFARDGIAIGGTDPVAYFTEGRPVAGSPDHAHEWKGATWHFSTAEHRAAFEADPEALAPRYGGYCAWAMAQGYLAPTVPEAWTVHEGALYLNASRGVRRRWERDIPGFIEKADANWPGVLG